MLFNSFVFILAFLPLTLCGYFLLNRLRLTTAANAWLLFASLFFYGWWDLRYLPLILGSILFNYTIGGLLSDNHPPAKQKVSRSTIFILGLAVNIAFLGYFKYLDFFIGSVNEMAGTTFSLLHIVLPLGISFFTITQIAFLVDAYEGLIEERNLLNYALFVTFFPHLLAGPILHHQEMMPQFATVRNKVLNYRNLARGLVLFVVGLFKKVIIADSFIKITKAGFDPTTSLNIVEAWVASLGYTFQLYFDFSGYSDMAVGVGLMFNIHLPINFNSPYKATSIIDFWKRWHMTLTSFVTTYLYTPILRSFKSMTFARSLVAIFLAMVISGIWHGAGWTFIIWGTLHGLALVINHWWRKRKIKLPTAGSWLLTFLFVNTAFVFFRSPTVTHALGMLRAMVGFGQPLPTDTVREFSASSLFQGKFGTSLLAHLHGRNESIWLLLLFFVMVLALHNSNQIVERFRPRYLTCAALIIIAGYVLLSMGKVSEFLYFQF